MRKILILGAHQVVREGLKYFIDCHLGGNVFGEASTAMDALQLARDQNWNVAILDSTIEEPCGLNFLNELKQIQPRIPVLIISMHRDVEYALAAFQAGAAGYIPKDSPREELVRAVNNLIGGGRYVSPAIAEKLASGIEGALGRSLHQALSYRESEVLCLIASGNTLGEIARQLGLSVKTVSTYRARLLKKSGMRTNADIIRYAIHNDLGDFPSRESQRPTRPLRTLTSQAGRSESCIALSQVAGQSA